MVFVWNVVVFGVARGEKLAGSSNLLLLWERILLLRDGVESVCYVKRSK